jgi:hypothetical protein
MDLDEIYDNEKDWEKSEHFVAFAACVRSVSMRLLRIQTLWAFGAELLLANDPVCVLAQEDLLDSLLH